MAIAPMIEQDSRGSLQRERPWLLARALERYGICPGMGVAVLVCESHAIDRAVAVEAIASLGALQIDLGDVLPPVDLAEALRDQRPAMLVACAHGVDAWRSTHVPLRVVGDGQDVLWWRALELREAAELRKATQVSEELRRDLLP